MTKRTGSNINVRVPKLPRFDLFSSEQHEESIYLNDTDRFVSCENEEEKNQDFDARDNISLIKILPQTIPSSLFPNQEEEYVKISKETSPSVGKFGSDDQDHQRESKQSCHHPYVFDSYQDYGALHFKGLIHDNHSRMNGPNIVLSPEKHSQFHHQIPRITTCDPHPNHQYIHCPSSRAIHNNSRERRRCKTDDDNINEMKKILQAEFPNWNFDAMSKSQIVESCCYYLKSKVSKQKEISEIVGEIQEIIDKAEVEKATTKTDGKMKAGLMNLSHVRTEIYSSRGLNQAASKDAQQIKSKNKNSAPMTPYLSKSKYSLMVYNVIFGDSSLTQMVAVITGKIISCNDVYLHLTRQDEPEVCSGTMFSVVETKELPRLYRFVASALNILKLQKMNVDAAKKGNINEVLTDTFACQHTSFSQKKCLMKVLSVLEGNHLPYFFCTITEL